MEFGPYIGYTVNQQKSWLIVKDQYFNEAKQLFAHSRIRITSDRRLGSVIGDSECTTKYHLWIMQLGLLIIIAKMEPLAAYCVFVHCLKHKFIFIMRTVSNISEQLEKLDQKIYEFIETILNGYKFNEDERTLYSLPEKFGGNDIIIPTQLAEIEYNNSISATNYTKECILKQQRTFDHHGQRLNSTVKNKIKHTKSEKNKLTLEALKEKIYDVEKKRALEASIENGASMWLTALPLKEHGLALENNHSGMQ